MTYIPHTPPAPSDIQPLPCPPEQRDSPDAALVPLAHRHDGWTGDRQRAFIAHLADGASVTEACKAVGMSEASAYRLRNRPDAAAFEAAWDEALRQRLDRLSASMIDRGVNGELRPRYYKGEVVGEERVFSDRLQIWLMQHGERLLERAADRLQRQAGAGAIAQFDDEASRYRVWRNEYGWITNAPLPPGWEHEGLSDQPDDHPDYWRFLSDEELEAWEARPEQIAGAANAEAARRALFGLDG